MIAAIIPCYNEQGSIKQVVALARHYVDRVIVIDNNSHDHTARVALEAGAEVYYCGNKGMGAALYAGMDKTKSAGLIVTLDGDLQHDPNEIPKMLAAMEDTDAVIGIRENKIAMPFYRKLGNQIITLAYSIGTRERIPDTQCGFRVLSRALVDSVNAREQGFGCITEFLIKARKAKARIRYVPVSCRYHRELALNSTMNPVKHGLSVLLQTLRWRIWELTSARHTMREYGD